MAALNINRDSAESLGSFEIIGNKRAKALACYRKEHGSIKSWDDLRQVPGFSEEVIRELQKAGATLGGIEEEGEQIH